MTIREPGHVYDLRTLDRPADTYISERLTFVNREPGHEHPGTQTQEVLRALIDRTMHCDNCLRWPGNDLIIHHLRMALVLHEARALERKTEKGLIRPEQINVSVHDGHFALEAVAPSDDAAKYDSKPKTDSPYRPKMPCFTETPKTAQLKAQAAWQSLQTAPVGEIVEGRFIDGVRRVRAYGKGWQSPDGTKVEPFPMEWRPVQENPTA